MYARRLTTGNFESLLSCKNIGEMIAFLKKQSKVWAEVLSNVNEKEINRTKLEILLRKKIFYEVTNIFRYEVSVGEQFAEYMVREIEIEQIIHGLRLLLAGKSLDVFYLSSAFFSKYSRIDTKLLLVAKNYGGFLKAVKNSSYWKILSKFEKKFETGSFDLLSRIEIALYTSLYEYVYLIIKKSRERKTKEELYRIFDSHIDIHNYVRLSRMKRFYKMKRSHIMELMLPFGTLRRKILENMAGANTQNDVYRMIKKTSVGKRASDMEFEKLDELSTKVAHRLCTHLIRFSSSPSVVMISFSKLIRIETINIIKIVEGMRYAMASEEVSKMLVLE
jgi:V/A-type H+-transporting ATPase subunit C